jgi:hypothetical protein
VLNFIIERPSAPNYACAPVSSLVFTAHAPAVGVRGVLGASTALVQQQGSVQAQRTRARQSLSLTDQGLNGFAAKAIGMGSAPVSTDVRVSGVPPRGKPV